ncbi:unnamed protein product, partial [marine sediment metagenome]
ALQGLEGLISRQAYSYELSPEEIAEWHLRLSDPLYAFIEDKCVTSESAWIPKDDLYKAFLDYCDKQNIPRIGKESFGRALKNVKNANVTSQKRGPRGEQIYGWERIRLKEEEEEEKEEEEKEIDMEV